VVGTSPAAGSQAKKGSEVTLQISSGDNGQRPVPNVLNQEQNDAEQLLRAAGFTKVSTRTQQVLQPQFDGRVIEQSPGGGQLLDTGDQVQLVIGKASESTGGN
jgi:serine/threonine-protein kinase